MYYLFIRKKSSLDKYKIELEKVMDSIDKGRTPVYNEMRSAKTCVIETIPYQILSGAFLVGGATLLNLIDVSDVLSVAIVLIVNSICNTVSNYVFTLLKHFLRIKLCKRLGIEPTEKVIAGMESLEYQSV